MKLKTLLVSVLVLAALSVAAYIARRPAPPPSADARINQPLVERAAIEKAAKLKLSDAGKSVELVRQTDGTWRVASYFDLPADFGVLAERDGEHGLVGRVEQFDLGVLELEPAHAFGAAGDQALNLGLGEAAHKAG